MKNNRYKPKNNNLSLAWEKINTIIERDLAFVIIIMSLGLLHSDEFGLRGFPVPWLSGGSSHIHSSPAAFIASLVSVTAIVVLCEALNFVMRRGSEPTAFRNTSSNASIYANTYDDTQEFQDIPDTGAFESKDTRNYSKALRKNQKLFRKAEAARNTPPVRTKYVMGRSEKTVLRIVLAIFASSIILLGAISGVLFTNDSYDDDIASDDYDTEYTEDSSDEYGSLIGTPFFDDDEYLQDECDRIIGMLTDEDEEGLSEIGEGDAAALIGLTDWGNSEYVRDYRFAVSEEPDQGFIRFLVTSGDKKYMLGIRFEGDGLATDESKAVVTGVTACPHTPWEELDPEDEDYWNDLENKVEEQSVTVGNADFMGYSVLTW